MPSNEAVSRAIADFPTSRRGVAAMSLGVAALAYLAATIALATRDQLWNDELFTYYFAHLSGFRDVWDQLSTGVEQTPPLYYAITRGTLRAFGDSSLALRLPGLVGVLVACACLYTFVARRSSMTYGLMAALIVLSSQAVFYAHEARPYGLVLGLAAASLLCWQLRGEPAGSTYAVAGMTLSLGLAVACHYYAVLLLVPLALGEGVRTATRRRVDVPVLAGFAVALVPLVVAAPLIQGARTYSGAFWADFGWRSVAELNGWLFETAVPFGLAARLELSLVIWLLVGMALHVLFSTPVRIASEQREGGSSSWLRRNRSLLVVGAAALLGALALRFVAGLEEVSNRRLALLVGATLVLLVYGALRRTEMAEREADGSRFTAPEAVAAFGFLLLPLFAVTAAKLATGAYTERYVLPAIIGIAVLLPLALHRLDGGRRLASLGVAVALLLVVGWVYWDQAVEVRHENRARDALIASLERTAAQNEQPIVIADPHYFLELAHYAPPALSGRLLHLSSREASLRYTGSYSTEEGLVVLSGFAPLDVRNFDRYVASGRPFLLLLRPERVTWVVPALEAAGRALRPYPNPDELSLYEVT